DSVEILGLSTGLVGEELQLEVKVLPEDAEFSSVTWSVNLNTLATINNAGLLSLLRSGTVVVTVNVDGLTATKEITINKVVASVNDNNYGSIQAAINAAVADDVIYIKAGTYSESFTINKSNLSFYPEGGVVVLTGLINFAQNLQNIKISGFEFTGAAQIKSTGTLKGFDFEYNYVHDLTLTPNAYAPVNRINVNAFIQFYRLADQDLFGDINIRYNEFEDIAADIISLDRTMVNTVINIEENIIRNFGVSAIRFDGGYNNGTYNIINITFVNDELSAGSAITFRPFAP